MPHVNTLNRKNSLRFTGFSALVFVVVLSSYGMRSHLTQHTEKLPQSVEKKARTLGHVSQVLVLLKTAIFLDTEDINKR